MKLYLAKKERKNMTENQLLLMFIVIAFVLTRGLPFVGKYLKGINTILSGIGKFFGTVNTMFHEDGHALMGLIAGKGVQRIKLFANTEGLAETLTSKGIMGWIPRILISIAGYPFSSGMALLFFYLLSLEKFTILFYGLAAVAIINLVLWVRNLYGVVWLIAFIGILGGVFYLNDPVIMQYTLMFIGSIMLVESVTSAWEILVLSIKTPKDAGDATSLKQSTAISARVWGVFFLAQALYLAYLTIDLVFIK